MTQYFTQLNSYHVVLEVTPRAAGDPALFSKLYLTSPLTGQQVPLSTFVKVDTSKTSYLSINHQGQFPAVTLSFNLAPGRRARRGGRRDQQGAGADGPAAGV